MWLKRMRDRYLRASVACRLQPNAEPLDNFELLVAYYIDLDPRPDSRTISSRMPREV